MNHIDQRLDLGLVRPQDHIGRTIGRCGEQFERSAALSIELLARGWFGHNLIDPSLWRTGSRPGMRRAGRLTGSSCSACRL